MTLSHRLLLQMAAAGLGLLLVVAVCLGALELLRQKLSGALDEYQQLRWCYQTGREVVRATETLRARPDDTAAAYQSILAAILRLDAMTQTVRNVAAPADPPPAFVAQVRADLMQARIFLGVDRPDPAAAAQRLNEALNLLAGQSAQTLQRIHAIEAAAAAARQAALAAVAGVAAAVLLLIIALNLWQWRSVITPLRRLELAVRTLPDGRLDRRAQPGGDRELRRLAESFNAMADQLQAVYRGLEEQVRVRSVQLARSDRLASIGLLAAGVAHEINNPLAIIAAQAELALQTSPDSIHAPALAAIRDEAFRCKEITGKLLSLARPAPPQPRPVNLAELARDVTAILHGLAQKKPCTLTLHVDPASTANSGDASGGDSGGDSGGATVVLADDAQLKQVLVNLLLNAIAAVEPHTGRVDVRCQTAGGEALLIVTDNGAGMDADTLEKIFEPFFTLKRPHRQDQGAGLGLSVTHAIVREHAGRITAHSDGPGKGSTLTVALPLYKNT